jgi:hypothetical protein
MLTFEFQAQVENGTIIVPDEHQAELAAVDRVTITIAPKIKKKFLQNEFIQELIANPAIVPGIRHMNREQMHDRQP